MTSIRPTAPTAGLAPAAQAADAKAAMGWMHTARFLTTAAQLHHLPRLDLPEIAFVGRSNAGKSTCINTLAQQKQLAFASKKPGRTQHINLFSLGRQGGTDAILADLPGYGYAAVPQQDKIRWQRVMGQYLVSRENLTGVVLLCDPRLGLTELDELLLDLIRPRVEEGMKFLLLLTKSDKLNRMEADKALQIAKLNAGGGDAQLFSALKRKGVDETALRLRHWVDEATAAHAAAAALAAESAESVESTGSAAGDMAGEAADDAPDRRTDAASTRAGDAGTGEERQ